MSRGGKNRLSCPLPWAPERGLRQAAFSQPLPHVLYWDSNTELPYRVVVRMTIEDLGEPLSRARQTSGSIISVYLYLSISIHLHLSIDTYLDLDLYLFLYIFNIFRYVCTKLLRECGKLCWLVAGRP